MILWYTFQHMTKNNDLYNLMTQATQEARSLWRIESDYQKDAAKNPELKKFWKQLAAEKKQLLADLEELIKAEM